jgi:N-methylhydantoinase A
LTNDIRQEYSLSRIEPLSALEVARIADRFRTLEETAREERESEGFDRDEVEFEWELDLRYEQQGYELTVSVDPDGMTKDGIRRQFNDLHEGRFGHKSDEPIEIVNYRVIAAVEVAKTDIGSDVKSGETADPETSYRDVYYPRRKEFIETPIYDRKPPTGSAFEGPLIIERVDTTIVIEPDQTGQIDAIGNTIVEVN